MGQEQVPTKLVATAADSKPPLKAIKDGGGGFAESQAVAIGGAQVRCDGEGDHLEVLLSKGFGSPGKLPGICDEHDRGAGVVLAQPGGGDGGVLPGGAGAVITGHQGRGNAEGEQALCRGPLIAGHISGHRLTLTKPVSGSVGRSGGYG